MGIAGVDADAWKNPKQRELKEDMRAIAGALMATRCMEKSQAKGIESLTAPSNDDVNAEDAWKNPKQRELKVMDCMMPESPFSDESKTAKLQTASLKTA